ncbi:hypothetical protein PR002_g13818 [Phytophthora rubi]|uniref:Uncharacterized protein n=1 Tax=Phytophthora rubi TaxID=129364 RepID=A0A6A3L8U0_9STRA|nr:hypothetical protein PR002_g13818 [Phytophthora rubi]
MRCSRAPACRASTGNAAAATSAAAAAAAVRGGGAVVASSASFQAGLVACKTRTSNQYEHPKKAPANAHVVYLAPDPSCCASSGNAAAAAARFWSSGTIVYGVRRVGGFLQQPSKLCELLPAVERVLAMVRLSE